MGPPIQVFLTSIASAPALRQRQEHLLRILQVKKIPFTSYDLASDEEAKKLWRRKAPSNNAALPGILVGGEFPGAYADFEEAVEFGELDRFFRLKEAWGEEDEALAPAPAPQKPIGVPGVATPLQVTGQKPSFSPSPSKPPKKPSGKSVDLGAELSGFGLEGVKVSEEEMLELVESLGLGGDDADDFVKGLGLSSKPEQPLKAKLEAAANASPSLQTTTKVPDATDSTAKPEPSVTTAAPSDQIAETNPTAGLTNADVPTSGATTASAKPESAPTVQKNREPDGGSSPKNSTQLAESEVASAVAAPSDDTRAPSATNGEKSTAAESGATAGSSAQDESQTK
ncbi:hypothetical protein FRC12_023877 [Ceratobasidium sp. 428]|nr:hypothetical protein FRC12_023877 [Ceratobasidium sp. 428]